MVGRLDGLRRLGFQGRISDVVVLQPSIVTDDRVPKAADLLQPGAVGLQAGLHGIKPQEGLFENRIEFAVYAQSGPQETLVALQDTIDGDLHDSQFRLQAVRRRDGLLQGRKGRLGHWPAVLLDPRLQVRGQALHGERRFRGRIGHEFCQRVDQVVLGLRELGIVVAVAGLDVPLEVVLGIAVQKYDAGQQHLAPLRALRRQGPEKLPVKVQGQSPGFRPHQRLVFPDQALHLADRGLDRLGVGVGFQNRQGNGHCPSVRCPQRRDPIWPGQVGPRTAERPHFVCQLGRDGPRRGSRIVLPDRIEGGQGLGQFLGQGGGVGAEEPPAGRFVLKVLDRDGLELLEKVQLHGDARGSRQRRSQQLAQPGGRG